jgi:hypothetical protein
MQRARQLHLLGDTEVMPLPIRPWMAVLSQTPEPDRGGRETSIDAWVAKP